MVPSEVDIGWCDIGVAGSRLVGIVSGRDFLGSEKDRLEMETGLWERL